MEAAGRYWLLGASPRRLCLEVEGFATGMTLFEATGQPVAVAFTAGNLLPVAKVINARTKRRAKILICADDDWIQKCRECGVYTPVATPTCAHCGKPHRGENAGVSRSAETALAIDNAEAFVPVFAQPRPTDRKGPTDFNDLASIEGQQVVVAQFEKRLDALEWRALASTPTPAMSSPSRPPGGTPPGDGGRRDAVSVMFLDDAVERFLPIDDGTGDFVWDHWTRKIAKRSQMIALLPAGVRGDDLKRHDVWRSRGAVYLDEIGFDPAGTDPGLKLNTWQGWPMAPAPGSCEKLLDLLEYLCSKDKNPAELFSWVLCWMAWPLQNPGGKMHSALIMHGPQGTGKSTIFQVLSRIYGDYATVLNQRGLEDKFNADWSDSKLLIVAEEVINRKELRTIGGELKDLVTGEWIRVNPKGIAAYRQRNHVNVVFLSNDILPLLLDGDDRRHCVVYTPPELSEAYYDDVHDEIANGGAAAFYHHLLHLDLSGFHPRKRPPMTEAKQDLMDLSAPSDLRFLSAWIAGDTDWPLGPCEAKDLYAAYIKWCRVNGESYPKSSITFWGTVKHAPGWEKKQCRVYRNLNTSDTDRKHVVFPPSAALVAADRQMPPGASEPRWITESVFSFANTLYAGKIGEG
jgi:putative DNA primase/helicase